MRAPSFLLQYALGAEQCAVERWDHCGLYARGGGQQRQTEHGEVSAAFFLLLHQAPGNHQTTKTEGHPIAEGKHTKEVSGGWHCAWA